MLNEQVFNKFYNAFLLIGMAVVVTVTSAYKFQSQGIAGNPHELIMLVVAALAGIMGVVNTVLSANGNIMTFIFGIVDVSLMALIYFDNKYFGNFALHFFYFLPMQFIGWVQWRKKGAGTKEKVRAERLTGRQWGIVAASFIVGTAVAYKVLFLIHSADASSALTDTSSWFSASILLDSVVFTLNIIGQVLMSFAFMEQWYIWNLVNVFSILMWVKTLMGSSDGLDYTVVMLVKYSFYLLNSINGLRIWLKLSHK